MTAAEKVTAVKVGQSVKVAADPAAVTGPDGVPFTVRGGVYVIDRPGLHVVDGRGYRAKGSA